MRALLDGVYEAEEGFQEIENDAEFEDKGGEFSVLRASILSRRVTELISVDAEGDVYESDFQSTDDEVEMDDGEKELQAEARAARKVRPILNSYKDHI